MHNAKKLIKETMFSIFIFCSVSRTIKAVTVEALNYPTCSRRTRVVKILSMLLAHHLRAAYVWPDGAKAALRSCAKVP
jgi:hypothetical protein